MNVSNYGRHCHIRRAWGAGVQRPPFVSVPNGNRLSTSANWLTNFEEIYNSQIRTTTIWLLVLPRDRQCNICYPELEQFFLKASILDSKEWCYETKHRAYSDLTYLKPQWVADGKSDRRSRLPDESYDSVVNTTCRSPGECYC